LGNIQNKEFLELFCHYEFSQKSDCRASRGNSAWPLRCSITVGQLQQKLTMKETISKALGILGALVVIFAVLDFLNLTGWLLYPVTSARGVISGNTDPLVAANNSPAAV